MRENRDLIQGGQIGKIKHEAWYIKITELQMGEACERRAWDRS